MSQPLGIAAMALAAVLLATAAVAGGPRYALQVDGLACPFCAYGIEKQLRRIPGVEHIQTDIEAGVVCVTMAEGHALEQSQAAQAVAEAGFTLGDFRTLGAGDDGASR